MVRQGGQIFSNGTATDPVVMTSDAPVGQRARGDWGGVIINGDHHTIGRISAKPPAPVMTIIAKAC